MKKKSTMEIKSNVTAIIPCYNDGQYIMQAVNSILNQTLKAEKIIIVDDGSEEITKTILKSVNISDVRIIFQENKGVSNARNMGIGLAQTDYILTLDADDYFEPTFIEKAVRILNEEAEVGIVSSYCRRFKNKKIKIEIVKPLGGNLKNFIIKNNGLANALFRKQCWDEVSGYDEKMIQGYEDWEFWIAILKNKWSMYILKEVLSHYRIKEVSRDKTALKNHDFELRKYIYFKHKEVYQANFEFYSLELLRQNSEFRNTVKKIRKGKEYIIGINVLKSFRFIKKIILKK